MSNSFKEREITRLNKLLASYDEEVELIKSDLAGIEERYRKLIEAESAELNDAISYYNNAIELVTRQLNSLGITETPVETVEEPKPEEPEKVVDTIYPENNEEQEETSVDEPVSDEVVVSEEASSEEDIESWEKETESDEKSDDDLWDQPVEEW